MPVVAPSAWYELNILNGSIRLKWLLGIVVCLDVALVVLPPGLSMLDARVYYSADGALAYLEQLGAAGRAGYFVHECVDLAFIGAYTFLFWQLATRWRVTPRFVAFAPGVADLVETAGILWLLNVDVPRSHFVAAAISYATCCKWLAFLGAMAATARALGRRTGSFAVRT